MPAIMPAMNRVLAAVVNWIDQTAPTISFTSVEFDNAKHQSATVTITAADNANGIAAVVYRLLQNTVPVGIWQSCDNGAQIEIKQRKPTAVFTVEAVATDGVGNSLTKVSGIVLIDVTAPTAAAAYSIVNKKPHRMWKCTLASMKRSPSQTMAVYQLISLRTMALLASNLWIKPAIPHLCLPR